MMTMTTMVVLLGLIAKSVVGAHGCDLEIVRVAFPTATLSQTDKETCAALCEASGLSLPCITDDVTKFAYVDAIKSNDDTRAWLDYSQKSGARKVTFMMRTTDIKLLTFPLI